MIYISHLDLLRLFARALRRGNLPFYLTEGFNPHPKISILKALSLGIASCNEEARFYMNEKINEEYFKESMNKALPRGVRIEDVFYES